MFTSPSRGQFGLCDRLIVLHRPQREHTEIEEELHEVAHIDYNRVSIVNLLSQPS